MTTAIKLDQVSIVFGDSPEAALPYMDQQWDRAAIQEKTNQLMAVRDCSLEVEEGEIFVLMGLSGSGKSTLLRAVNGLNPVIRGSVHVNNGDALMDVTKASSMQLRKIRRNRVAMVFQQFALLPWRTVAENVGLGLELAGMPKRHRREAVLEQLALVGLENWADNQVSELSGGMQQRVGLARAFATQAPILLMDEPFSALDPLIRCKLQDELLDLQQKLKRTILFVSHDLDEAFKLGNRIAIMEGGLIKQIGTPQTIFSRPADDYVSEFVANMNPLGVLRVCDGMVKPSQSRYEKTISHDTLLSDSLDHLLAAQDPLGVTKEDKIVGELSARNALQLLSGHLSEDSNGRDI
ncbi:ATP-binding cassette domain-containing protein [uncultured Cohaesibacter sp.]|uniref:quaternary amine ABC transporter ATP-binding protein n=1 Tax=uncultured Cohaesibacter sp. TaxID=1002546 RepID=UPI002AA7877B|nr:ATP-binding cassette domain-containing protein [uncultured Cohaesibacter sp.]